VVDAHGIPLAAILTPANVHDSHFVGALLDAIPPLQGPGPGRPRRRPDEAHADKGYDYRRCRAACRARHILAPIARRGIDSTEKLGRHRWVVERDYAWLNAMRRLRTGTMCARRTTADFSILAVRSSASASWLGYEMLSKYTKWTGVARPSTV
jgi:transposase